MQFLAPLFLAGAALIALPILLHLLRRDVAPQVPFPAVRLLRRAPVERARTRRLRDLLLLAARVLALLLMATAFARPYRARAAGDVGLTIVAVDRSFSMGAPGVFERARALARSAIDADAGRRVALVAFDDRAEVVAGPGLAEDARAALAALTPGAGGTTYSAAFERAATLAGAETSARLVVISDLQRAGLADGQLSLPGSIDLQVRDPGGAGANLSIDDFEISQGHARVAVHNRSRQPVATTLRIEAPSSSPAIRQLHLSADGTDVVSVGVAGAAGPLRASIADGDGYAADNERFALAGSPVLPRILVLSGDGGSSYGFYFSRALMAGGEAGTVFDVRVLSGQEFTALPPSDVAQAGAVAVLSTRGIGRTASDSFRALFDAGGGVFAAAGPETTPAALSRLLGLDPAVTADEESRAGTFAVSDVRHPIFRAFDAFSANLARVAFDREWRMGSDASLRTLAAFSDGAPALVERAVGNGRFLLFASDVDRQWNDFPLHPMFVPFAGEVVRYVAARRPPADAIAVADVPADVPATPGIHSIRGRPRVVNVDTRESAVERMTPAEFVHAVNRTNAVPGQRDERRAREREAAQGLWRYGLGLMLVTLVLEGFVGAR